MPLKSGEGLPTAHQKPAPKTQMWTENCGAEKKGRSGEEGEAGQKAETKELSSIKQDQSQQSNQGGKVTADCQKNGDMDFLFKQFPLRNSFTIDDSRIKKWRKESVLGKRGSEVNVEESKEDLEMSLITDLKGLEKYEQNLQQQKQTNCKKDKKKFISDFFGERNPEGKIKKKTFVKR